jgi:SAM-dependent methyltransferase
MFHERTGDELVMGADGYATVGVADLWHKHIVHSGDIFRETEGGLYDRMDAWVQDCHLGSGSRVIDICCGQGVTSQRASKRGAYVLGVDVSEPLINIARGKYRENPNLSFQIGDAANLYWISDGFYQAGMMINGIFHIGPESMPKAVSELSRVTKGGVLITGVNPDCYEDFAAVFTNQTRCKVETQTPGQESTEIVIGDPEIAGPNGTRIILKNTPFVMHPEKNLYTAFENSGLELVREETYGNLTLVGGPDRDLFVEYRLEHIK